MLISTNVLIVFIVFKCLFFIVGILGNACVIIYNVFFIRSKTPTTTETILPPHSTYKLQLYGEYEMLFQQTQQTYPDSRR